LPAALLPGFLESQVKDFQQLFTEFRPVLAGKKAEQLPL
jgi:hypothetical protein